MDESKAVLSDEEICAKGAEFARRIVGLSGRGQGTERNQVRAEWTNFLKSLKQNGRRTIARNAYWAEYDILNDDE